MPDPTRKEARRQQRTAMRAAATAKAQKDGEKLRAALPRGPGGEALLSQKLIDALAALVREGMPIESAARVAGVVRKTLGDWIAKGATDVERGKHTLEAKLAWALDTSLGDQERGLVRLVMAGANRKGADGAQIALGVLAVRRPDHWAAATPAPADTRALYSAMTEQELRSEVTRLLAARNPEPEKPKENPS